VTDGSCTVPRKQDPPLADKLQFERFRDLIERSRLGSNMAGSSEKAHLDEALAWWDSVLDRAAILAAARAKVKEGERESSRNRAAIGYNYGTGTVVEATAPPPSTAEEREDSTEAEREDRLMRYINGLNDADAFAVDKAAAVLGVRDYCRQIIHLRRLKLDLAREQNKDKGRHRRRRRHRHRHRRDISQQQSGNRSPVYGRYGSGSSGSGSSDGSGSDDSGDEASGEVQYITEFDQQQSSSGRASTTTSKAYDGLRSQKYKTDLFFLPSIRVREQTSSRADTTQGAQHRVADDILSCTTRCRSRAGQETDAHGKTQAQDACGPEPDGGAEQRFGPAQAG